jgi:nucleoside 2-deoxyribosyltransferase
MDTGLDERSYKRLVPADVRAEVQLQLDLLRRGSTAAKPLLYFGAHIEGFGPGEDNKLRGKNAELAAVLSRSFGVFLPQVHNPYGFCKRNSQGFEMALVDFKAIAESDVALFAAPFGRDTSCEAGFAKGMGKTTVFYVSGLEQAQLHKSDWMLLNSFSAIIVLKKVKAALLDSPAVSRDAEIIEIADEAELPAAIRDVYEKARPRMLKAAGNGGLGR